MIRWSSCIVLDRHFSFRTLGRWNLPLDDRYKVLNSLGVVVMALRLMKLRRQGQKFAFSSWLVLHEIRTFRNILFHVALLFAVKELATWVVLLW